MSNRNHAGMQSLHQFMGRDAVLLLDPAFQAADKPVRKKVDLKLADVGNTVCGAQVLCDKGKKKVAEMLGKGILSGCFERGTVETAVLIEIVADCL